MGWSAMALLHFYTHWSHCPWSSFQSCPVIFSSTLSKLTNIPLGYIVKPSWTINVKPSWTINID
jgi:hypothetical protein